MPHGVKKKKKGRRNAQVRDGAREGNKGQTSETAFSSQGSLKQATTEDIAPNFEAFQQREKVLPDDYRTVYSRYKAATKRVFEYLQENARENLAQQQNDDDDDEPMIIMHVSSLIAAADWMAEAKIRVDPDIIKDLKFAIRVRSKVARSVYGGGDSGHKYLLDTLVYCWKVLDSLPRAVKKKNTIEEKGQPEEDLDHSNNRFEALQETGELEDEEGDSILDEEIFSSQGVPRPSLDADQITLQDLFDAEDRMDAWLFLLALNDLMGCVVEQYAKVAKFADSIVHAGACESGVVPSLMGATIAANMAIQQVQRLEIEFELQNPHINTPYRLLSTWFFGEQARRVTQITREHGQKACSVRDANLFVGDCLECWFRHYAEQEDKKLEIQSDFCSRFQIDSKGSGDIDELASILQFMVTVEVPFSREIEITKKYGRPDHSWLPPDGLPYIGGDRAIHHTIRMLQWFGCSVAKKDSQPNAVGNWFGLSPWQPGRSNKIHTDLDELLMAEILPNWFVICRDWILSQKFNNDTALPRQSEVAPFWSCFRQFVYSPEKPVRWSTVFAVHAMLAAILETDKITIELGPVCQKTFDSYFHQLDIACEHKKGVDGSFDSSFFRYGVSWLQIFKRLGNPSFGPRVLWNPLCAGTSLLYLNFVGNFSIGTCLIDDRAQLKIVLHLYHALIVNDILQREDIPFLYGLYDILKKSKGVWGRSMPPQKGKLVEHFWLSMRGSLPICDKTFAMISCLDGSAILPDQFHLGMIDLLCGIERRVFAGSIYPAAEVSTSFRRICNRDFHDVVVRQEASGNDFGVFKLQFNDTLRAFINELPLFAYNLPACGVYLDEFVCGMSRFFQWDQLFKGSLPDQNTHLQHPERIAEEYMFAHHVLGALDQANDPSELGRIRDFVTSFMCPFFEKLSNENTCVWLCLDDSHL